MRLLCVCCGILALTIALPVPPANNLSVRDELEDSIYAETVEDSALDPSIADVAGATLGTDNNPSAIDTQADTVAQDQQQFVPDYAVAQPAPVPAPPPAPPPALYSPFLPIDTTSYTGQPLAMPPPRVPYTPVYPPSTPDSLIPADNAGGATQFPAQPPSPNVYAPPPNVPVSVASHGGPPQPPVPPVAVSPYPGAASAPYVAPPSAPPAAPIVSGPAPVPPVPYAAPPPEAPAPVDTAAYAVPEAPQRSTPGQVPMHQDPAGTNPDASGHNTIQDDPDETAATGSADPISGLLQGLSDGLNGLLSGLGSLAGKSDDPLPADDANPVAGLKAPSV
ncbi:hypothetical protein GQ54DRAFT_306518 [Martensiomyces pterosporus]|nr:hypothetical protein GQ54DRAFT_306518 [Martensiomyces pterosporus]